MAVIFVVVGILYNFCEFSENKSRSERNKYTTFINSSWGISQRNMRVVIFWTMFHLSLGHEKKALLMIDLSKAFDTINHELLITKLSIYGVSPSSLKWFKAYLTSRRQYVRIDNVDSNSQIIRHGVPQGSILGPLLFIIFMNDINLVPISNCELHLYADDTTMLTCSPTMDQLMTTTNQALTTIVDWFLKNKLIVNLKKTMYDSYDKSQREIHL